MNKIEAQMQGKKWIPFEDIPQVVRNTYDMLLAVSVPGIKELWKQMLGNDKAYEQSCEYWWNNALEEATQMIKRD